MPTKTLFELIHSIPAERTAVALPESNLQITYGALRDQIEAIAQGLAAAGVKRGDRVGIALPNGLPMVVSFFAAAQAGTAAPLNPAYKEDEFRFYLEDTDAKVLILPPEGLEEARKAAAGKVPILSIDMDATGNVAFVGSPAREAFTPPSVNDVALVLHTSGSTGRPKRVPLAHANLAISAANIARHYGLNSGDVARRRRSRRHVVFGGADDSPAAARARESRGWETRGRREASLHPVVQRG